jgi:hypothetical protein
MTESCRSPSCSILSLAFTCSNCGGQGVEEDATLAFSQTEPAARHRVEPVQGGRMVRRLNIDGDGQGGEHRAIHARQLALEPRLQILRRHSRPLLLRLALPKSRKRRNFTLVTAVIRRMSVISPSPVRSARRFSPAGDPRGRRSCHGKQKPAVIRSEIFSRRGSCLKRAVPGTYVQRHKRTFPKERWTKRSLCIRAAPQFAESTHRRLHRASQKEPQHFP